ncbi:MAG: site-specific integrase [Thermodesulfovibrionales bacterium]|nr:site-specific integrase [Thermodesulfovibrionales bacterium]
MAKTKGIYKRGNIYWIRYTSIDGKQKRESTRSTKKQDAELLYAKRIQAVRQGQEPVEIKKIPNVSFRQLSERYLAWVQGRQNSAKIKMYMVGQLLSVFGDILIKRFTTSMIDQLQTDLINKGYKPSSNNKITNLIKHMFHKALEWELITEDVLKRIRKVKPLKDDGKRLRYLSKEECHSLINNCEPHLKPIVIMALNTGMRRGEILNLKWSNIDLKHGFILLDKTKNGERRELPINSTLRATLQSITRRIDVPYVFYNPETLKPFRDIKKSFSRACKRAGITDFHFHDLRHTFASHLVMSGVDLTTVSRLLGHKDIKMTLRYSHLAPDHVSNAVNVLDKVMNGNSISTKLAQFGF